MTTHLTFQRITSQLRPARHVQPVRAAARGAVLATLCLVFVACGAPKQAAPAPELLQRLARGVNLSHWWVEPVQNASVLKHTTPNAADLAQLRNAGLQHVRLPVALRRLADDRGHLSPTALRDLHDAVQTLVAADLAVIVAVQTSDAIKQRVLSDDGAFSQFRGDWETLAKTLRTLPSSHVVLELLNEPTVEDPGLWARRQLALARAVRAVAPRHTLLLTGAHYSDIEDLTATRPIDDGNVVYSFHFYAPHNFTHQGADWGWPMWRQLRGLPYPSSPESVDPILDDLPSRARPHATQYGAEAWDRDALTAEIQAVAAWAARHQVPVQCSEFGVILSAPDDSRERWRRDARHALENAGIGWTVWDYAGRFAIAEGAPGSRTLDLP